MFQSRVLFFLIVVAAVCAFVPRGIANRHFAFKMSEESPSPEVPEAEDRPLDPKLFDMNRIVRLGRSRDQDGKSNIWSIEPKMEVVEDEEGGAKTNLVIGGAVVVTALAVLPLFSLFSKLFPDPADF